ncbi:MAG TPA: hypothetical protein VK700_02245 [Steroidobacteraceae bacterium]|jgi:hypothetical protein|nr:hypothetical protein [Steroidobacteraceae bacterium]
MAKPKNGGHSSVPDSDTPSEYSVFVLVRDDEKPLQFVGKIVAEVESPGPAVTHRAAIYRTRGGRFIAEFSSRPSIADDRIGIPPIDTLEQVKRDLLTNIRVHAEWHNAQDARSESDQDAYSADRLMNVKDALNGIRTDHPAWLKLLRAYERHDNVAASDAEKAFIRYYASKRDNGDAITATALLFLEELTATIEHSASVGKGARGKAKDFATIEEAKNWFRPGRLTNELLRQFGGWDPELIE